MPNACLIIIIKILIKNKIKINSFGKLQQKKHTQYIHTQTHTNIVQFLIYFFHFCEIFSGIIPHIFGDDNQQQKENHENSAAVVVVSTEQQQQHNLPVEINDDDNVHHHQNQSKISAIIQQQQPYHKKISKPMIEKRRRDRINRSLSTLKQLIIDSKRYPISNVSQ